MARGRSQWTREMEDDLVYWVSKGYAWLYISRKIKKKHGIHFDQATLMQKFSRIMGFPGRSIKHWPDDWWERVRDEDYIDRVERKPRIKCPHCEGRGWNRA